MTYESKTQKLSLCALLTIISFNGWSSMHIKSTFCLFSINTRSGIWLLTTSSVELFESISQLPFLISCPNVFEHKTQIVLPLILLYSLSFSLRYKIEF